MWDVQRQSLATLAASIPSMFRALDPRVGQGGA